MALFYFWFVEFDSSLVKMNSRKNSVGANNPTSWMDNLGGLSQQLNMSDRKGLVRDTTQSVTIRNMQTSASRNPKQSPSGYTNNSLQASMRGPTTNLRNLAG